MFHVLSFHKNLNRVLLNSVFFGILFLLINTPSNSASILNFGQWRNLNSLSKTAYTAGALDTILYQFGASSEQEALPDNFYKCFRELQITTIEVVAMIDNFYKNEKNWGLTPQAAIDFQLISGHCYHYLN